MDEREAFIRALLLELKSSDDDYNKQDVKFVRDMIPHHEMAVKMAEKQISKGSNGTVVGMAKSIKKAQAAEIAELKKWLSDRDLAAGSGGTGTDMGM